MKALSPRAFFISLQQEANDSPNEWIDLTLHFLYDRLHGASRRDFYESEV